MPIITYWASTRNVVTSHHYVSGGEIKGWQNGLAIARTGFAGFYPSLGFLVAYLVVLLLAGSLSRHPRDGRLTRGFRRAG